MKWLLLSVLPSALFCPRDASRHSRIRILVVTFLVAMAAVFFILSWLQPAPGRRSWFTGLAGDPSVSIGNSDYEISRNPDETGLFTLWRWGRDEKPQTERRIPVAKEVTLCAADRQVILVRTSTGWVWVDLRNGTSHVAKTEDDLRGQLPIESAGLVGRLAKPKSSNRYSMLALVFVCLVSALVVASARSRRRW